MQQKGFFRERLGYHDGYICAFALTLYRISEQLCYLQARTKHAVLALFQIIPRSWNQTEKKKSQQNSFPPPQFGYFLIFFFLHTDILLFFLFYSESSGLKTLSPLGILRASECSGLSTEPLLAAPAREGLRWSMCWETGGNAGGKGGHVHFEAKKTYKIKHQQGLPGAHASAGGWERGSAGRRKAGWMEVRIQIENRWDFSCQPDIRERGRRGKTSPRRGCQPGDMGAGGLKNPSLV